MRPVAASGNGVADSAGPFAFNPLTVRAGKTHRSLKIAMHGPTTWGVTPFMLEVPRFPATEAAEQSIIEFPYGLIGIPGKRYALRDSDSPFSWLQSIDNPSLSMPVTNPFRFVERYAIELSDQDDPRLPIGDLAQASTYATVRHDAEFGRLVLNLRAPIVIVGERGYQVINQAPDASLRAPIGA
jgi:flagellar assembly factor FliW